MRWGIRFWEEPEPLDIRMVREEIVALAPSKGDLRWTLRAAEKIATAAARATRKAAALERSVRSRDRILEANSRAEAALKKLLPEVEPPPPPPEPPPDC